MSQEQLKNSVHLLSEEATADIDIWIAKYPEDQKQSAVMSALRIAQDQNGGWLTDELIHAVAEYLDMPRIAVFEVATFYSMYSLQPVGRHQICVCNSISCLLKGSEKTIDYLQEKLGVKIGEVTADGKFSIKEVECLAACVGAPAAMIGKQYYEYLTPEKIDQILEGLD